MVSGGGAFKSAEDYERLIGGLADKLGAATGSTRAAVDAGIALSAFVSAAELAGLGSCPISQIRDHVDKVNELLALPDWVVPVAGLALGYPEAKEPLSARLSLSATVHTDRYDVEAVERELDAYDARRGKDWSGDKVKQYSEVMRADFGQYVAKKRFRLV